MRKIDDIFFKKHLYIVIPFVMLLFLHFGISGAEAAGGFSQTDFTFAGAPKADKDMQIFDILQKLGNGLITSGRAISGIVIAVSGMMWILGANTNLFSSILKFAIGVSIITNIAWFVNSGYFFDLSGFATAEPAFPSVKDITVDLNTSWNFLGVFMVYYERVIIYASSQLMPYALKLLGFLTILEMVSVLMFKQNGDHFHYLVHSVIKTGVFLFLLANWINGSTSIANSIFIFFEDMGIIATDFPGQVSAIGLGDENSSTALVAENIMGNAAIIAKSAFGIDDAGGGGGTLGGIADTVKGAYDVVANGKTNIIGGLCNAVVSLVTIFVLIMTAGCLILTRLEFWTMALMALLLIPFGANQHTRFLFERVIGGVFNLGIKMSVISFICYCATPILTNMVKEMTKENSASENIILGIACLSGCYTIMMLANKAPALVSGLLNGSPQMTRGDLMTPTRQVYGGAKTAVNTMIGVADKAGSVGGTIAAASNQAGGHNAYMAEYRARKAAGAAGMKVLEGSRGALALGNFADDVKAHMRGIGGTMSNLKEYGKTEMPGKRAWNTAQSDYRSRMENDAKVKDMAKKAEEGQPWNPKATSQQSSAVQANQKNVAREAVSKDLDNNIVGQSWSVKDESQQASTVGAKQMNAVRKTASNEVNRSDVSNETRRNVKENVSTETVSNSESVNKTENIVRQGENKIDHTDRSIK